MLPRIRPAGGEQFLAALGHERFVLAVGGDDDSEFLRELEGAVELGVVDAKGSLRRKILNSDAALDVRAAALSVPSASRHAHVELKSRFSPLFIKSGQRIVLASSISINVVVHHQR
jgi:hypothetical protein